MEKKTRNHSGSRLPDVDLNSNTLFEQYTVDEIRKVERDTRVEIEKKKEDLRQMVGERYRDLIEAADTITEMKSCAEKIVHKVAGMQQYCSEMRVTGGGQSRRKKSQQSHELSGMYGIAAQSKLLMDMPEKIWSALDCGSNLRAAQLYLLSCHIVSSLQLDINSPQSANLLSWLPVLSRQWTALSHFKDTILQSCRWILRNMDVPVMKTVESLCSIVLLEDSSPRQVFTEFLLTRKSAVEQYYHAMLHGYTVKSQVCGIVASINRTLKDIYAIFYSPEGNSDESECNLLMKTLLEVTGKPTSVDESLVKNLLKSSCAKYLPPVIQDFRPEIRMLANSVAVGYLQESCEHWVDTCLQDINSGVATLFGHVSSIKGMTAIRDAVWTLLLQFESSSDGDLVSWNGICQAVLNKPLNLWEESLRSLFLTRAQTIIQDSLNGLVGESQQGVEGVLARLPGLGPELDVAAFVWTESAQDMPSIVAAGTPAPHSHRGSLYMKSRAFTPSAQSVCEKMNQKLKLLLEDLTVYVEGSRGKSAEQQQQQQPAPFDRFADATHLYTFLQSACSNSVTKLLTYLDQLLDNLKRSLVELEDSREEIRAAIDRVLFAGRLCDAMTELVPHLEQCMMGSPALDTPKEPLRPTKKQQLIKSLSKPESEWDITKKSLTEHSEKAYRIWSGQVVAGALEVFRENLLDTGLESSLAMATQWDTIGIQEESEEGQAHTSTIRLPTQSSWYVQLLLHTLCRETNRVGGHAIDRCIMQEMIDGCLRGVLAAYRALLDGGGLQPPQSRALQLLYDLQLLATVLAGPPNQSQHSKQIQEVREEIEAAIDPFDLDVFSPYLQANLQRHVQRCAVLYGALFSAEHHVYTSLRSAYGGGGGGHQESHNVMPLMPAHTRFNLLPLSTPSQPLAQRLTSQTDQSALFVGGKEILTDGDKPENQSGGRRKESLYTKLGTLGSNWLSNIGR